VILPQDPAVPVGARHGRHDQGTRTGG
jgi:hypothetical protein